MGYKKYLADFTFNSVSCFLVRYYFTRIFLSTSSLKIKLPEKTGKIISLDAAALLENAPASTAAFNAATAAADDAVAVARSWSASRPMFKYSEMRNIFLRGKNSIKERERKGKSERERDRETERQCRAHKYARTLYEHFHYA